MNRLFAIPLLFVAACAPSSPEASGPMAFDETVVEVPGFVDFLTIDEETVWATNRGRVEQWSVEGLQTTVEIPKPCGTMALLQASLWVANCEDANLYRVDIETGQVQTTIATGIANPRGETNVVSGAGAVWVPSDAEGKISRIDPATNEVTATIDVVAGTFFLAFGFDALWAVSSDEKTLQRIDPATNEVVASVELGTQPGFLAAGEGGVWVQEQGDGTVARVDPETNTVTQRVKVGETLLYGDIDVGEGKVWLRTTEDQTFVVLDAETMEILARVGRPEGSGAIRYTPDGIWTSAHDVLSINWWTRTNGEEP